MLLEILKNNYSCDIIKQDNKYILFYCSDENINLLKEKLKKKNDLNIDYNLYYMGYSQNKKIYKLLFNFGSELNSKKLEELIINKEKEQ